MTTVVSDNVVLIIRMDLFPLLSGCINHGVVETMSNTTRENVRKIFRYVSVDALKQILATQPDSDVTVIECVNQENNHHTLYAHWKKNKDVPRSLKKNQWLGIIGDVKDQGAHEVCWAVVVAEIVSAVRYIKGFDEVKTEYSIQDVVDFTNPKERGREKETGHYCYPGWVYRGLQYVSSCGIQREEARPFQMDCKREITQRIASNLGYIREAVTLNTIEDALVLLHEHPVACTIPIFMPEYGDIKNKIYCGPTTRFSKYVAMHAVNIIGAGEENGEKYVLVRSSHGKRFGIDGNLKVSIEIMMVCLTPRPPKDVHPYPQPFYLYPKPLLSQFAYPKLLSMGEENVRKNSEGSWIIDIDPQESWVIDVDRPQIMDH